MSQKDLILLNKIWSSLFNNGFKMTVIFCSVKMQREHLTGISFPEKIATPFTLTYVSSTCEYHRAKLQYPTTNVLREVWEGHFSKSAFPHIESAVVRRVLLGTRCCYNKNQT